MEKNKGVKRPNDQIDTMLGENARDLSLIPTPWFFTNCNLFSVYQQITLGMCRADVTTPRPPSKLYGS